MAGIARSEGDYMERASLHYKQNDTESRLEVKQLQVADEAVYKCEITYIEVREGCSVVQFINLTALIKPEYVRITKDDSTELQNASTIGPYTEGEELTLTCESGGGKPIPSVAWWNGTHKMTGEYSTENGANSVGTGRNKVQLTLGRGDLRAKYECRAMNDALDSPMVAWIKVDVHVRPLSLDLSGVAHHVVQGTNVLLECAVLGARPPANVTWYNGTEPILENILGTTAKEQAPETRVVEAPDGTYETRSLLAFTATRYENGEVLTCEGTNPVMQQKEEKPMRDTLTLEVLYPPIVTVSPENVTVNESTDILLFCSYEANPNTLESVSWLRDGEKVILTPDHYEGGTIDQPTLMIKNSTRHDQGVYTCVLENKVGSQESNNVVYVAVYFKPIVKLMMEPPTPVSELDRLNITLMCKVESGNPDILQAVRWYLDGELLKELPDCGGNVTDYMFCDIDPSKLLLEDVGRSFHGNYSCEGMNEAGWGPLSADEELIVYYPPGAATLVFEPSRVVKKGPVTLRCSVDDAGRPETTTYRWLRGTHLIQDVTTANWTIDSVTLEVESNFTCLAYNEGGEGDPATVYIDVYAPPAFIERLQLYNGALVNASNINISCRVECSPLCAIQWLKDGKLLNLNSSSLYTTNETIIPPDTRTSDFESIKSTLIWNMTAWPGGQLDRIHDSANYTCHSTQNVVGPGVKSSTTFRVEYPPENITVSNKMVNVTEQHIPEKVICSATAYPEASYQWKHDTSSLVVKGNALILSDPVTRNDGGNYTCEASNRHGKITQKTLINVLYKPECGITQGDVDGKLALICTAHANPKEVDFTWRIKSENYTLDDNIEKKGLQSILILDNRVEQFRTYVCIANNSEGASVPCERDVTPYQEKSSKFRDTGAEIGWWNLDNDLLIIIIAIIAGIILMVLIITIIITIVCRRKRAEDKYNNPVEMEERENPEGDSSIPPAQVQSRPVHKWPLRPGVLVHVNGTHSLSVGRLPQQQHDGALSTSTPKHTPTRPNSSIPKCSAGRKDRIKTAAKRLKRRRAANLANLQPDDTNQHSRANKIRQMFSNDTNKYHCETLPGVIHGKSGVVTFKKLDGPLNNGVSRKRKKPGTDPSPSVTKDKSRPDLAASPSDGLLQPDGDKAFYENLPFHGMQSAPNKPAPTSSNTNATSRPSSQLSQYGSSGYGSTRSHVGPHLNNRSQSITLMPKNKFSTLQSRNSKHSSTTGRHYPQFYSMRLRKKDHTERSQSQLDGAQIFQLHTMPIKENSPESKSSQQEAMSGSKSEPSIVSDESQRLSRVVRPVPAPRKQLANKSTKHTYQNVPIPITPNTQEPSPQQLDSGIYVATVLVYVPQPTAVSAPPPPPPPLQSNIITTSSTTDTSQHQNYQPESPANVTCDGGEPTVPAVVWEHKAKQQEQQQQQHQQ
ncbi:hemicentin-2 isoform X4 [Periplaneta americana]|uniref:hemicentin-2 isoform X4 n=1 Tax=Periplaneta americana TaxID=6978 RepID=UPI0037E96C6A